MVCCLFFFKRAERVQSDNPCSAPSVEPVSSETQAALRDLGPPRTWILIFILASFLF